MIFEKTRRQSLNVLKRMKEKDFPRRLLPYSIARCVLDKKECLSEGEKEKERKRERERERVSLAGLD